MRKAIEILKNREEHWKKPSIRKIVTDKGIAEPDFIILEISYIRMLLETEIEYYQNNQIKNLLK